MLNIKDLSFWEKSLYFESLDFTIIGAGIVGLSTAIFLKEKFPGSKILILERGYLPSGASTKNAGFACFGSPTELLDDLPEEQRQTFLMHHFDSLTLAEVADAMHTSLPTAKSRLRLAKEKLRYQLTCRGLAEEENVPEMN